MLRSEIISKLFSKLNKKLSKSELEKILDIILNSVVDGIAENKASEWRNFGRFSPKKIKEKIARNPRTNEKIYVPEKTSLKFKMGKVLKNKINQNESNLN
jgi:nucleoid DNA-binding protein|tara:strand:- start:40 stop:339 length:300 start_codon:yes stop_codon:yes gene_type:complete